MAKRIIIEIDETGLHCAEATTANKTVQINKLFAVKLNEGEKLIEQLATIKSGLAAGGISRGEVDVIVNRREVEMREITVPPVPNDELPELLKFTAKNEFASVNDQWRLDFVPFTSDESQARTVLASALSPKALAVIEALVTHCHLRLNRILLRPYCIAIAANKITATNQTVLLVQRVGKTLETILVSDQILRANRSVLLGSHSEADLQTEIKGELTRTLLATNRILSGKKLDDVILLGSAAEWEPIVRGLDDSLTLKITDPRTVLNEQVVLRGDFSLALINDSLGTIGAASSIPGSKIAQVDFENPRRRVVRELNYRKVAFWGALAGAAALIIGFIGWSMLSSAENRIDMLTKELSDVKMLTEPQGDRPGVAQITGEVDLVDQWHAAKISWLGELAEVSQRLLTADEVVLSSVRGRSDGKNVIINLIGNVNSKEANTDMKTRLITRPYRVEPLKFRTDDKNPDFQFSFENQLLNAINVAADRERVQGLARAKDAANATPPMTEAAANENATNENAAAAESTATKSN